MKIESSNVKMEAFTKNELDIKVETSFEFKQTLLGFVSKENEEFENKQTVEALDIVKQKEDEIEKERNYIKNEISKIILEMILVQFLGIDPKKAYEQTHNECTLDNENRDETAKKTLIQTDYKYERVIEYTQKESIDFSTKATIQTKDKNIDLDLNLSYTKDFYEKHEKRIEFSEVNLIDPLIIQYDKNVTAFDFFERELSFTFDIDANGEEDNLAQLKEGNGFLALDKNSNGIVDDGNELFGPSTNNGFEELREYDNDKNGWIDESDSIFKDLKIWTKNQDGEEKLFALGDSEIGAIYLNDTQTQMDISRKVNDPLAHLKSTSFFLREDGTAGILSSLDFVS